MWTWVFSSHKTAVTVDGVRQEWDNVKGGYTTVLYLKEYCRVEVGEQLIIAPETPPCWVRAWRSIRRWWNGGVE